MEGSLSDKPRTIRTLGDILWHMQLAYNLSAHDGHLILRTNHNREDSDLYGRHPNFHSNHGGTSEHSKTSTTNISRQQTVATSQEVQVSPNKDRIPWSHPITR